MEKKDSIPDATIINKEYEDHKEDHEDHKEDHEDQKEDKPRCIDYAAK